MSIIMCSQSIYEYKGWTFEYGLYQEPWPLRKDGEPRKKAGATFYKIFLAFINEPDWDKYKISGGCERL